MEIYKELTLSQSHNVCIILKENLKILDYVYSLAIINKCLVIHFNENGDMKTIQEPMSLAYLDGMFTTDCMSGLVKMVKMESKMYDISHADRQVLIEALGGAMEYIDNAESKGNHSASPDIPIWNVMCRARVILDKIAKT